MQLLVDFYNSYKRQDSELASTIKKLNKLLITLKSIQKTLSNGKYQANERSLMINVEISIRKCDKLIHELQAKCQKFSKSISHGIEAVIKVTGQRALYFFRQNIL